MAAPRAIEPSADGSYVLRAGRVYALLVVVNGPTTREELEVALQRDRFVDPVASSPDEWRSDPAPHWPKEPLVTTMANECLVRASAILAGPSGEAYRFDRDRQVEPGATYTFVAVWDFGEAPKHAPSTGAAAPAATSSSSTSTADPPKAEPTGISPGVVIAGITALGVGAWALTKRSRQEERDEKALLRLMEKERRQESVARAEHYLRSGATEREAEELASLDVDQVEHAREGCGA